MSEMGDDFKALREHNRAERDARLPARQAEIEALRDEPGHRVTKLSEYHYRVNGLLDLFPVRRRWHHHPTNTRGGYQSAREVCKRFWDGPK